MAQPPAPPNLQAGQAYPAQPAYQGPVPAGPGGAGGHGQTGQRQAMPAGPQPATPGLATPPVAGGPGLPPGPGGPGDPATAPGQQARGALQTYPATAPTGRFTRGPHDQRAAQQFPAPPADQPEAGAMPAYMPQQPGPYGALQPAAYPQVPQQTSVSLADAVQAAHGEGFNFGQSVARDAPALWLEAVLARKPRMPSDLEARLLQDSALPIDSLLHDEVRHALRRGFWDALERARH